MAFKASKKRERRTQLSITEGTQLIASAAVREWYEKEMRSATKAMLADYKQTINDAFKTREMKRYYAQDASAQSLMTDLMAALDRKWAVIFKNFAAETTAKFIGKVDQHSRATCWHSLTTAGIEQPRLGYTANIQNTVQAASDFNNTLITGIQADAHNKIYTSVMLSLTSPDPEQQGVSGIENELRKTGEFTENRIKLIARDQNSKLYSSLNIERMRDNGVDKFKWVHSSAGKTQRADHVAKDGMIFTLDDPRLWTGPKGDQGPPGWAINCRCRAVPVI